MNRYALYHCGLDNRGHRHWRLKPLAAIRRCRQHAALHPRVAWVVQCSTGRELWRNGMQHRHWMAVSKGVRADRQCFLMTLSYPALVSPVTPDLRPEAGA